MKMGIILLSLFNLIVSQENFFNDYQYLLSHYVDAFGRIAYKDIKKNEMSRLKRQYRKINNISEQLFNQHNKNDLSKLSFYINLYNFITIYEVVNNYPVNSIKDINGVWKKKHRVVGLNISLDELEHDLIRPFKKPECHFALICAAYSCPPIQKLVYNENNIRNQFKKISEIFYQNPLTFQIDEEAKELFVSQIFNWYTIDFQFSPKGLKVEDLHLKKEIIISYLLNYGPEEVSRFIRENRSEIRLEFIDWNWKLNEAI